MLATTETHNAWLVDAKSVASLCTWWDQCHNQVDICFQAITDPAKMVEQLYPLAQAPQTPTDAPPAKQQPEGGAIMHKMFALLKKNCDNQQNLMAKVEESKNSTTGLMCALNTKMSTLETAVGDQSWQLEQQKGDVEKLRAEQGEHVDAIQSLQASNEVVTEEVVQMKERLYQLENQLANPVANHVHYHDCRTVVVLISGIGKYHIEEATDALPVLWYNYHGHPTGSTTRKVFLPPQKPRKHPTSGEWMVDLVEHSGQKKAVFQGIYTKYLTFSSTTAKRQRCNY